MRAVYTRVYSTRCAHRSINFTALPSKPTLSVQPTSFTIGDAVNVLCATTSTGSSLSYAWQRSGVSLPVTSSQLSIASFSNSDTGSYTCTAKTSSLQSAVSDALILLPSGQWRVAALFPPR